MRSSPVAWAGPVRPLRLGRESATIPAPEMAHLFELLAPILEPLSGLVSFVRSPRARRLGRLARCPRPALLHLPRARLQLP
eukprot:scaffold7730_cov110-Isochrysis_galbana.AAC.6